MIRICDKGSLGAIRVWGFLLFAWAFSYGYGVWWVGVSRWRLIVRAPWDRPLFSERYGFIKPLSLLGGWRIQSRLVPR